MKNPYQLAYSFLSLFSQSKYLSFVMDKKGNSLESFSRSTHALNMTLDNYMARPIQESFQVPGFDTLDDLFRQEKFSWMLPGVENLEPGAYSEKLLSFASLPMFDSRNLRESQFQYGLLFSKLPVTRLFLLKLSENRFLAIVTFDRGYDVGNQPEALIDEEGRLLHFGRPFMQWADIREPASALGRPLPDFIILETPLFSFRSGYPEPRWERVRPSAACLPELPVSVKQPRYVMLPLGADFRNVHFSITLKFVSVNGLSPNLVIGAVPSEAEVAPDIESLNVFFSGPQAVIVKTSQHELVSFTHGPLEPEKEHELRVERVFRRFRIHLDRELAGEFFYDWAPMREEARGLALLIRPGERHEVRSADLRTAPMSREDSEIWNPDAMASPRTGERNAFFRIRTTPLRMEGINTVRCRLEDVTHLRRDIEQLRQDKERLTGLLHGEQTLPGTSPAMVALRHQISKIAKSDITVLIEGETGTGKEVLARALHQSGSRRKNPFVKIDCAALPENLMETELFGHEKGAFTGAVEARPGRFEQAQGGTVFLDEVANLTPAVQAKLLNILQDRRLQRVGGGKNIPLDIRIISASNIPLNGLIREGRFREDLYYRLNPFRITLPPLKDRPEDIPLFAVRFAEEAALLSGKKAPVVTQGAMKKLVAWPWPGNLRELRNVMVRAVIMSETGQIDSADVLLETRQGAGQAAPSSSPYRRPLPQDLGELLKTFRGNLKQAALHLKVHRTTLHRWVVQDRLDVKSIRIGR